MATMTVRHECGHKSRVDVGNGPAHSRAQAVFDATLRNCPACEASAESDEGFAISQNARIEQAEQEDHSEFTVKRQSREAQYNQRVQAAYNTLRETANRDGQVSHRAFSVASTSQPGAHHTVTWDTASDHTHCDCTAGQYGRDCVHQAAMRRYIAGIHAADARRTDAASQVRQAAADRARDTSILRRNNQPFSLMR